MIFRICEERFGKGQPQSRGRYRIARRDWVPPHESSRIARPRPRICGEPETVLRGRDLEVMKCAGARHRLRVNHLEFSFSSTIFHLVSWLDRKLVGKFEERVALVPDLFNKRTADFPAGMTMTIGALSCK